MGYHGTCLLAQLHQEWLKLWGLLTLRSPESNLRRDLLQWPTLLLYHYHLTSLWTVFNRLCVTERPETLKSPDSALWILFEIRNETLKRKTKPHWSTLDIISASRCLIPWCLYDWFSVCAWVCTCCVSLCQQTLDLLGPSAVQACWNVIVLILYFQRCFRAYEKISFMFL